MKAPTLRVAALGGLVLAALLGYAASPYYAARQLQNAARDLDEPALVRHIDFVAVKAGLKADLDARLTAGVKQNNDPFAALALAGAQQALGKLIDIFVQPKTMMLVLRGDRVMLPKTRRETGPPRPNEAPASDFATPPKPEASKPAVPPSPAPSPTLSYASLNRFHITVPRHEPDSAGPRTVIRLELCREYMVTWKLCRLSLPI